MKPIKTRHTNKVLGAPEGWDALKHGPCVGLPICQTGDPYMYSWWAPTWRERLAILFGRPVQMCIVGEKHPPVSVEVGCP